MRNFIGSAYKMVKNINAAMLTIANVMLGLLTVVVSLDVIMRYVFNSPVVGVKQFAEYGLVWFCFLSVGWVLIERKHVAIGYLEHKLCGNNRMRQKKFTIAIDVICLFYTIPLLWLSGKTVWTELWAGSVISGEAGGFPTFLAYLCIPLGFLSLTLILMLTIAANIMGRNRED